MFSELGQTSCSAYDIIYLKLYTSKYVEPELGHSPWLDSDKCFILTWWKQEVTAASTVPLATPNSCTAIGTWTNRHTLTLSGGGRGVGGGGVMKTGMLRNVESFTWLRSRNSDSSPDLLIEPCPPNGHALSWATFTRAAGSKVNERQMDNQSNCRSQTISQ